MAFSRQRKVAIHADKKLTRRQFVIKIEHFFGDESNGSKSRKVRQAKGYRLL
jgi:hypothetical protein